LTYQYESGMFVVKAGSSFSAYFWDGLSSTGTWDTILKASNLLAKVTLLIYLTSPFMVLGSESPNLRPLESPSLLQWQA